MIPIKMIIPGEPVSKGRPRFRTTKAGYVITYTPPKTKKEETRLSNHFQKFIGLGFYNFPMEVVEKMKIVWYFKRPQRLKRKSSPSGPIPHTMKPDLDNLLKLPLDAMKGHILVDDCKIYKMEIEKYYCALGGTPRMEIEIWKTNESTN